MQPYEEIANCYLCESQMDIDSGSTRVSQIIGNFSSCTKFWIFLKRIGHQGQRSSRPVKLLT